MASQRQYATISEVEQYADVTSTDNEEFEQRISIAEELIDAYVGAQPKFMRADIFGQATAVDGRTIVDDSARSPFPVTQKNNYYTYCHIQIVGGAGAGQTRQIASSSQNGRSVTVDTDWTTLPDETSVFRIFQPGKFPRTSEVWINTRDDTCYKTIPEAVKRAVAAQVEFMINMGDDYFNSGESDKTSEHIGNYSYSKSEGQGQAPIIKLIAPKAKTLLRGIKNNKGQLDTGGRNIWPLWRHGPWL
jgi:hypothetical protein